MPDVGSDGPAAGRLAGAGMYTSVGPSCGGFLAAAVGSNGLNGPGERANHARAAA